MKTLPSLLSVLGTFSMMCHTNLMFSFFVLLLECLGALMTDPSPIGVLLKEIFPVVEHAGGKTRTNKNTAVMLVRVSQNLQH